MAPMTLRGLERGGSGVTMGAYLAVMQVLGVEKDLALVGKADPVGRDLQDAQLPAHARPPTATRATSASLQPSAERLVTGQQPMPVAGAPAGLRNAVDSAPQEPLRRSFEPLPSEQMHEALEASPKQHMQAAPAAMPSVPLPAPADRPKAPTRKTRKLLEPSDDTDDTADWIEKSGFASADALAGLIDPVASTTKKSR